MKTALQILAREIRNPFLKGMLALTIVLGSVAIARTGIETLLILSSVVIILFISYLLYLRRNSNPTNEYVFRDLAHRIITAIKDEGYVPGNNRQRDFGAALVVKVRGVRLDEAKKGGEIMAQEFIDAFDVPESVL